MADKPMPVIDGHNDVLLSVYKAEEGKARSFFTRSEEGHLDLPRAREGGFAGGFFAVFIPPPPAEKPEADRQRARARELARTAAAARPRLRAARGDRHSSRDCSGSKRSRRARSKIVRTADEMDACLRDGVLGRDPALRGRRAD